MWKKLLVWLGKMGLKAAESAIEKKMGGTGTKDTPKDAA